MTYKIEVYPDTTPVEVKPHSVTFKDKLSSLRTTNFSVANTKYNRELFKYGRIVDVFLYNYKLMRGYVKSVVPKGEFLTVKIVCQANVLDKDIFEKDYGQPDTKVVEYTNTLVSDILSDVLSGTGFTIGSVPYEFVSVRFEYATKLDCVKTLAKAIGKDWWFTDVKACYIGDKGTSKGLVTPVTKVWKETDEDAVRDQIIVTGVDKNGNEITAVSGTGDRKAYYYVREAIDSSTLQKIADALYAELSVVRVSVPVILTCKEVSDKTLVSGDSIDIEYKTVVEGVFEPETYDETVYETVETFRIKSITLKDIVADLKCGYELPTLSDLLRTLNEDFTIVERSKKSRISYAAYGFRRGDAFPTEAEKGWLFYRTDLDRVFKFDGTNWIPQEKLIDSGTTFPENPATGDLFYREDENVLYRFDGTNWIVVVQVTGEGTTFPSAPKTGDLFYRTDINALYRFDGTNWKPVHQISQHGTTFPSAPNVGDWFYRTDLGWTFRYDGTDWIKVSHQSYGSAFPASPEVGDTFYHTSYEQTFYWDGTYWIPLTTIARAGTTFPTDKSVGDIFFRTDELKFYRWNGTDWILLTDDVLSIPQDNMVLNASAEVDRNKDNVPDYWKGKDGAIWTSGDSYEGKYCLELPKGTGGYPAWITMAEEGSWTSPVPYIAVEPKKKYLIRLRLRDAGATLTATTFNIRIHQRARDKTTDVGYVDNLQTSPGEAKWTEYSVLYQAASNAYWVFIEVFREGGVGSDSLLFDSVWMFKQISWDTIFDEEHTVSTRARRWQAEDSAVVNGSIISDAQADNGRAVKLLSTTAGTNLWIILTGHSKISGWSGDYYIIANLKVASNASATKTIRLGLWDETAGAAQSYRDIAPNEFDGSNQFEVFAHRVRLRSDHVYYIWVARVPDNITDITVDWVGIVSADVPLALTDVQILPEHTTGTVIQDTHTVGTAIGSAPSSVVSASMDATGIPVNVPDETWTEVASMTVPAEDVDLYFIEVQIRYSSGVINVGHTRRVRIRDVTNGMFYPYNDELNITLQPSKYVRYDDRYSATDYYILIPRDVSSHDLRLEMYHNIGKPIEFLGTFKGWGRSPHTHAVTTQPSGHPVTTQPSGHTKQEVGHKH